MLLNDKIDSAFKDAIDDVFVQNNTSAVYQWTKFVWRT